MISDKIRPHHLDRKAILYVRQSSAHQVLHNRESSALQYAMRERLTTLGRSKIEVIDDDLGRSAAGGVQRAGFERMVAQVCLGEVGAVAAREVSRFARTSQDWQQLIEMCRVVDTVPVDQETVYAPRHGNDRLLLGLKGSLNKYELDLLAAFARCPLREGPPRRTRRQRACGLRQAAGRRPKRSARWSAASRHHGAPVGRSWPQGCLWTLPCDQGSCPGEWCTSSETVVITARHAARLRSYFELALMRIWIAGGLDKAQEVVAWYSQRTRIRRCHWIQAKKRSTSQCRIAIHGIETIAPHRANWSKPSTQDRRWLSRRWR